MAEVASIGADVRERGDAALTESVCEILEAESLPAHAAAVRR